MTKGLFWAGWALFFTATQVHGSDANTTQVFPRPDGSLTRYVHVIPLFPEDRDGYQGLKITPDQRYPMPISTRWTCGGCHDYDQISKGFHFSYADPNADPGRLAQPWIYADPQLAVQVPISYRPWPGTYRPEQIGMDQYEFLTTFGRHLPGGGPGQTYVNDPCLVRQALVSGKLEVNCMACHSADPGPNMGGPFGYADQALEGNLRWAITASLPFARVKGSVHYIAGNYNPFDPNGPVIKDPNQTPPIVWYNPPAFDDANFVLMDLTKDIGPQRCYYCHSNVLVGQSAGDRLVTNRDVHILRGLLCTSCHANGIDHQMVRGFEGQFRDPNHLWAAGLTCQGCHLGTGTGQMPTAKGPYPTHKGIPAFHLEKLSCAACHSGPLPRSEAGFVKTSRAHALGTTYAQDSPMALPHIIYPVYARQQDGKIAPCKLIWPAFWGQLDRQGRVAPLGLDVVGPMIKRVIKRSMVPADNSWPAVSEQMITRILQIIAKEASLVAEPVYIAGGRMYRLAEDGTLVWQQHPAAGPVMWVAAHDVRPARTALGSNGCADCHSNDSPFFFGKVPIDGPVAYPEGRFLTMAQLQDIDINRIKVLNRSFVFRSTLKAAILIGSLICGMLVIAFCLRGAASVSQALSRLAEKSDNEDRLKE